VISKANESGESSHDYPATKVNVSRSFDNRAIKLVESGPRKPGIMSVWIAQARQKAIVVIVLMLAIAPDDHDYDNERENEIPSKTRSVQCYPHALSAISSEAGREYSGRMAG
jgi:hypothetical protein